MNNNYACSILGIDNNSNPSLDIIKKHYRIKALMHHPDKGGNKEEFILINNAYEYLINNECDDKNKTYEEILIDFLNNLNLGIHSNLINTIFKNILLECEEKVLTFLYSINKSYLLIILNIIKQYESIFIFNKNIIKKIEIIYNSKIENDEHIILNPLIDDLFNDNIFRLQLEESVIIIPLWHKELVYEDNDKTTYIYVNPVLPNNIEIDSDNNIIVSLRENIKNLLNKIEYSFNIGNTTICININKIRLKTYQQIILNNKGISKINNNNVIDNSKKTNIIVNLELWL